MGWNFAPSAVFPPLGVAGNRKNSVTLADIHNTHSFKRLDYENSFTFIGSFRALADERTGQRGD
jgi:hypothetical protein